MKKAVLALALCLLLCGCAKSQPAATPAPTAAPVSTPEPTEKPFELSDVVWQNTPDSDCFSRIGYADEYSVLGLVFRNSDPRIYLYYDYPETEWDKFTAAESLGSYYNKAIKGKYTSERID